MRVWEFKDKQGYRWILTEQEDKELVLEVVTFSTRYPDWEMFDKLQESGDLKFQKEYELKG